MKIKDTIIGETDIAEKYTDNETYRIIRQIVKNLPNRDREIIMLYFGFYNDKTYTQKEIADMMSISKPHVSRLIAKIVKRLGQQLQQEGVIELKTENKRSKIKLESNKKEGKNKMSRELQTIYEYFSSYTKEQVDIALEKLTEEERTLIRLRYGEDLNNPISRKLSKEGTKKFYGSLIPKIKRILSNTNKEIKHQEVEEVHETANVETITKDDYSKILELLKTSNFTKMMNACSPKESMIVSLKLGYIDGKCFSTSAISEFLGIEAQEVIDITRKVLIAYKERINKIIDETIQIVSEEPEVTLSSLSKLPYK